MEFARSSISVRAVTLALAMTGSDQADPILSWAAPWTHFAGMDAALDELDEEEIPC